MVFVFLLYMIRILTATAAFYSYINETKRIFISFSYIFVCCFFLSLTFFPLVHFYFQCICVCNLNFSNIVRIRQTITSCYLRRHFCFIHKIVKMTPKIQNHEKHTKTNIWRWFFSKFVTFCVCVCECNCWDFNDENSSNQLTQKKTKWEKERENVLENWIYSVWKFTEEKKN